MVGIAMLAVSAKVVSCPGIVAAEYADLYLMSTMILTQLQEQLTEQTSQSK